MKTDFVCPNGICLAVDKGQVTFRDSTHISGFFEKKQKQKIPETITKIIINKTGNYSIAIFPDLLKAMEKEGFFIK